MDWEDLKTFSVLTEQGSVRRAATVLGVHHATVARRIERLEADLGARLFDRRPEGVCLTQTGEELEKVATRVAGELNAASRQLSGRDEGLTGRVTVTAPDPLATGLLAPALPGFADRHPGLEIHQLITYSFADLSRGEADIAIRLDNNPPDTLIGKRLFTYGEAVYASPDYLAALETGTPPRWIGWGGGPRRRPAWVEDTAFANVPIWGGIPHPATQTAAARAGLGLIALPCFVGDAEHGLVRATSDPPRPGREIWLLTHPDLRRTQRVREVMAFLEGLLRSARGAIEGRATPAALKRRSPGATTP